MHGDCPGFLHEVRSRANLSISQGNAVPHLRGQMTIRTKRPWVASRSVSDRFRLATALFCLRPCLLRRSEDLVALGTREDRQRVRHAECLFDERGGFARVHADRFDSHTSSQESRQCST